MISSGFTFIVPSGRISKGDTTGKFTIVNHATSPNAVLTMFLPSQGQNIGLKLHLSFTGERDGGSTDCDPGSCSLLVVKAGESRRLPCAHLLEHGSEINSEL